MSNILARSASSPMRVRVHPHNETFFFDASLFACRVSLQRMIKIQNVSDHIRLLLFSLPPFSLSLCLARTNFFSVIIVCGNESCAR